MEENKVITNNSSQNVIDPEQLKIVVGIIKRCILELSSAKTKADIAWKNCESTLGENIIKSVSERKQESDKKFKQAIEQLEKYANILDAVSNIWKDTETQIMSSSKEFDEIINKINNNLANVFGMKPIIKNINDNKQNESSNI